MLFKKKSQIPIEYQSSGGLVQVLARCILKSSIELSSELGKYVKHKVSILLSLLSSTYLLVNELKIERPK